MTVLGAAAPALSRVRSEIRGLRAAPSTRLPELAAAVAAPAATFGVALLLEVLARRGIRLPDPAMLLLVVVTAGAAAGGLRAGLAAAAVAVAYSVIFFARAPWTSTPDNVLRVLEIVLVTPFVGGLVGALRDRWDTDRRDLAERREVATRLQDLTTALAGEPADTLHRAVADGLPHVVDCEMVALTIADRRDGRHVVRAVHGADASIVGTEMLPGVGVTGRAIRDGRLVSTTQLRPPGGEVVAAGDARRASYAGTHDRGAVPVVALPILVDGRAMATLTLARRPGGRPFSDQEHGSLELIAGAIGLVLSNAELRMEMAESSLRDPLTGLSNRSFLDASLDQLLALRRRAEPGSQPPMAVILFDVDGFRRSNERYGRQTGDRILRAIGGVIRARFRASDTMARIGGDGFLVVLDGAGRDDAARAAAEVRARVRGLALTTARGEPLRVSVSAGCATFHDTDAGAQAIIRTVEAALDTARWSGTDAIVSI